MHAVPVAERPRIERLHRWEDRQDSAIGWQLLQRLAGDSGLRRRDSGRPECDPPLDVSLSHSGGWIAAAASESGRVGVDVETVRDVSPSLARRCLSPSCTGTRWRTSRRPRCICTSTS